MLLLDMRQGEEGIEQLINKVKDLIESHGEIEGEIKKLGRRRLAYEIDDQKEGYYVLIRFISGPEFPVELARVYKITDGILRTIIIKRDKEIRKAQRLKKIENKRLLKKQEKERIKMEREEARRKMLEERIREDESKQKIDLSGEEKEEDIIKEIDKVDKNEQEDKKIE